MTPTLPQALEAIREEIDKNSIGGHGLVSSTTAAKLLRAVELLREQRDRHAQVYAAPDEVRYRDDAELAKLFDTPNDEEAK